MSPDEALDAPSGTYCTHYPEGTTGPFPDSCTLCWIERHAALARELRASREREAALTPFATCHCGTVTCTNIDHVACRNCGEVP